MSNVYKKYNPLITFNFNYKKNEESIFIDNFKKSLLDVQKKFKGIDFSLSQRWNKEGYIVKDFDDFQIQKLVFLSKFGFSFKGFFGSLKVKKNYGTLGGYQLYKVGRKKNYIFNIIKNKVFDKFDKEIKYLFSDNNYEIIDIIYHSTNSDISNKVYNYGDAVIKPDHKSLWHTDTTHPEIIKMMIYLDKDVTEQNGAFRYLPYSHILSQDFDEWSILKTNRYLNFSTTYDSLKSFYALPAPFRKRNTFAYLLDRTLTESYFKMLENNQKIFTSNKDQGYQMILFNPLGIHSGGFCYDGSRKAIQVTFAKKSRIHNTF